MKKVLIVEDNADILANLAEILELAGYEVNTSVNGEEGLRDALTNLPDLIISDIMMPKMNGYEMFIRLKESPETKNIPFIFLTALSEKIEMKKGFELGADDYIIKPFDADELLRVAELRINGREDSTAEQQP